MGNKQSREQGLRSGPTPPLTATPGRQTEEPIKATEPSEAVHSADSANVAIEPLVNQPILPPQPKEEATKLEHSIVLTVRPFEVEDEEQSIALPEPTMACLREQIVNAFDFPPDQTIRIYYTMPPTEVTKRKLLSPRAALGKILKRVENTESDVVFDYHTFVAVSVSNGQPNSLPTVLELSDFDVNLLKAEIMKQFQLSSKDFTLHYVEKQRKVAVDKAETFERACQNANVLFFDLPPVAHPTSLVRSQTMSQDVLQQDPRSRQQYDIFISYNWGTKAEVTAIVDQLKVVMPHLRIWMDHNKMQGNIYSAMSGGISSSKIVVAFLSKGYLESVNCNHEINFAADLKKSIVPVYLFENGENVTALKQAYGVPFLITAGSMYSDFKRFSVGTEAWSEAFNVLSKEVENALSGRTSRASSKTVTNTLKAWLKPVDATDDIKAYESEYVAGTRMWVVDALNEWLDTGERAMWMNGGAGTGKSLIAYSLLVNLPASYSVGSIFFCRHNDDQKRDPARLVSTIIWNLYKSVENQLFRDHVESEMDADNVRVSEENKQSILSDPVAAFETIVVGGLNKLPMQDQTLLIVIDALDELDILTRKSVLTILTSVCTKLPTFVKILTTGRPESDIYYSLNTLNPFILSPSAENNRDDLVIYLRSKVNAMWNEFRPADDARIELCFNLLIEKCDGLFIYARNICEYLRQQHLTPAAALEVISEFTMGPDGVYKAILDRAFKNDSRGEKLEMFHRVFGVILGVQKPLGLLSLVNVGNLTESETETIIAEFRSILKIENGVVSVIHKSVKDYLSDPTRCNPSYCVAEVETVLAHRCLQILCSNLHRNIANLDPSQEYSCSMLAQSKALNEDVQYAVLYWSNHFPSIPSSEYIKILHDFCKTSLLYYLETMLLLGKLNDVFKVVTKVVASLHNINSPQVRFIKAILNDLKFVAFNFRRQLIFNPLQTYRHALITVPQNTAYFETYGSMAPARLLVGAEKNWGPLTLFGHTMRVTAVALSSDGKFLASSSDDRLIKLWSLETGECLKSLSGHTLRASALAISPNCKQVVSVSSDTTVRLWDVETGVNVRTFEGHTLPVWSVIFSHSGEFVFTASRDKTIRMWSVETGECVKIFQDQGPPIYGLAISMDDKILFSGGSEKGWLVEDGEKPIKLWSVETGEVITLLKGGGHFETITSIALSPNGKLVASASEDTTIKIWSLETNECIKTLTGHTDSVQSVIFSLSGDTIISGSWDKKIKLWSVDTGLCINTLEGHTGSVISVCASADGKTIASGSYDHTIKIWSTDPDAYKQSRDIHERNVTTVELCSSSLPLLHLSIRDVVLSGSYEGVIKMWSIETGECTKTIEAHSSRVTALALSKDGRRILSGSADMTVKIWDIQSGECIRVFEGHTAEVWTVLYSSDENTVVSRQWDVIKLWNVETGDVETLDAKEFQFETIVAELCPLTNTTESKRFDVELFYREWIVYKTGDFNDPLLEPTNLVHLHEGSNNVCCWSSNQNVCVLELLE